MKSWDCFDTLIARRFVHPHSIFEEVGKRLNIPNFKEIRIQAERLSGSTYETIYKNLPDIDPQIEIDVEHEHCFPIVENIEQIQDGDLIISDMYHNKNTLHSLLRKCGLNKTVEIIVGNNIKGSGRIWKELKEKNVNIELHTGDNIHSDIKKCEEHNFKTSYCIKHKFLDYEQAVSKENFELACFMRFLRLQFSPKQFNHNQQHAKDWWYAQAHWNIPLLVLFAKFLEDKGELSFIYRDSHILHPLYEAITNKKGTILNCSRLALKNASVNFKKYLIEQTENKTIVDLHASSLSVKKVIDFSHFITLTKVPHDTNITKNFLTIVIDSTSDLIEKCNPYKYGTLVDINETGMFIRLPCEHSEEDIYPVELIKKIAINTCQLFCIPRTDNLLSKIHNKNIGTSMPRFKYAAKHVGVHSTQDVSTYVTTLE